MQTGQGHFVLKLSQIFQLLKKVIALNIWIKTEKKTIEITGVFSVY